MRVSACLEASYYYYYYYYLIVVREEFELKGPFGWRSGKVGGRKIVRGWKSGRMKNI